MSVKKPYCKVCHDAGKPESEYNNHWVKDLNGKTTCPTLLNTECRYCFKRGHTAKFCSVLAKNNKENKQTVMNKPLIHQNKPITQNKPTNGFAVLCNDDDEEEIINIVFGIKPEEKTSWASIASKPKADVKPKADINLKDEEEKHKSNAPQQKKSWADWSDSENEEDFSDLSCDEEFVNETW
jgi:hypothetical protein